METNANIVVISTDDLKRLLETTIETALARHATQATPTTIAREQTVYTFTEVRIRLNVSRPTLAKMLKRGDIRHLRCGRAYRFTEEDVQGYLQSSNDTTLQ